MNPSAGTRFKRLRDLPPNAGLMRACIMNHSLQRQPAIRSSISTVVAGLSAAGIALWSACDEAQEFQDDMLRKIAALVDAERRAHETNGTGLLKKSGLGLARS